mgnify:CR=1 FL=1
MLRRYQTTLENERKYMGKFINADKAEVVQQLMFGDFNRSLPREKFLMEEFERYIPQLAGRTPAEIADFIGYQRGVYLEGKMPVVGRPIASLNPRFIGSLDEMLFDFPDGRVYTRASTKENGYRFQFHRAPRVTKAFTRQFTPYDLLMFPDLTETFKRLPVMIGDAEIANAVHKHLAGFHRVELRIPAQGGYWPKQGSDTISDALLAEYLKNPVLFHEWGVVHPDLRLTLIFHGLFAISDPETWEEPLEVQAEHMISLCNLPVDYEKVDYLLGKLRTYCTFHNLNARIAELKPIESRLKLKEFIALKEAEDHEGVCVVQSGWKSGKAVMMDHAVKVKKYETIDTAVLGLYLRNPNIGLSEENVIGCLVGLYDHSLQRYLPATKLNLDPMGVQVKNNEQRKRLIGLRKELVGLTMGKKERDELETGQFTTLLHTFMLQGAHVLKYLAPDFASEIMQQCCIRMLAALPRGKTVVQLYELYRKHAELYEHWQERGKIPNKTQVDKHLREFTGVYHRINQLDRASKKRFLGYFSRANEVKATSAKMLRPQILINPNVDPIIIETQVFDLTWGTSPYPAGFHTWYCHSFRFNNAYPERIRFDKSTTTDYQTIYDLARRNTPRTSRRPYRKHTPKHARSA